MGRKFIWIIAAMSFVLFFAQGLWAQDRAEGRKIYLTYCSGCHGGGGKGNGPAAGSLPVKPANHTDGNVMNQLPDKELMEVISKGGAAVGKAPFMPAWGGQFKEKQIRDIVSYIRSLAVPPYNKGSKK